jgi:hypothetical protein
LQYYFFNQSNFINYYKANDPGTQGVHKTKAAGTTNKLKSAKPKQGRKKRGTTQKEQNRKTQDTRKGNKTAATGVLYTGRIRTYLSKATVLLAIRKEDKSKMT